MKKILSLTLILLVTSVSIFAADTPVNGSIIHTNGAASEFYVRAHATEIPQELLLKYVDDFVTATPITAEVGNWDVFANETTENFTFYTRGRGTAAIPLSVVATTSNFIEIGGANTDSGVKAKIKYASSIVETETWLITIPINSGLVDLATSTVFQITWDGSSAPAAATAPSGDYTATITLTVANPA